MTLRTPRRRISPRTKRRYRLIRDFFRRALGTASQQDIKINSSIALNVTGLKHKIVGIEQQLNEVSQHCHDFTYLENSIDTGKILSSHSRCEIPRSQSNSAADTSATKSVSTKFLYRPSNSRTKKSDDSEYVSNHNYTTNEDRKNVTLPTDMGDESISSLHARVKKKNGRSERKRDRHRSRSVIENLTEYSGSGYQLTVHPRSAPEPLITGHDRRRDRHSKRRDTIKEVPLDDRIMNYKEPTPNQFDSSDRHYKHKHSRSRKHKNERTILDQDFISDIIRKQYRPMKMFGRKESDISQFSVPVCRDQEYSLREDLVESPELCSCCYGEERPPAHHRYRHAFGEGRSLCDTRLYSSHRERPHRRRRHLDPYNDSAFYDVVPVKEKTSPKSRRKFTEEEALYNYCKEVPPSPRTHRPRLNLKAQHHGNYDDDEFPRHRHNSPRRKRERFKDNVDSDFTATSASLYKNRNGKTKLRPARVQTSARIQKNNGTASSLPSPTFVNEQANQSLNDNSFNKSHVTDLSDKTDKALCEIKDILQTFLKEMKKEALQSQCATTEAQNPSCPPAEPGDAEGAVPSAPSPPAYSSFNMPPPMPPCALPNGFVPPYTNPCCYSMLPMYPMNCVPNNYMAPSRSCSCHACVFCTKDTLCPECCKQKESNEEIGAKCTETDELIKEIHKFVSQNPNSVRGKRPDPRSEGVRVLTSRSVGGSSRFSKHDANVGTPALKCYSKSCEAIGSRLITDTSYTTATQSDTVLEKLNLEVTTQSDSEISNDDTEEKAKKNKFTKVLRSMGIMKKKKKQRRVSETESSLEVDIKPSRHPFRQDIVDYAIPAQEYYHRPPSPRYRRPPHEHRCHQRHDHIHDPRLDSRYDPRHELRDPYGYVLPPPGCQYHGIYCHPPPPPLPTVRSYTPHRVHEQTIPEHGPPHYSHPHSHQYSPVPPYSHLYDPHERDPPDPYPCDPLCLREIEIKTTGTQSEKKMSFFRKLGRKTPPPAARGQSPIVTGTQTSPAPASILKPQVELPKPAIFSGWKKFQEKVVRDVTEDPMAYGFRTHKKLAEGDAKMRKKVLKKMFYKKKPFSPNNLIVRTLLGNDPSSFGEPNVKLRTRLMI